MARRGGSVRLVDLDRVGERGDVPRRRDVARVDGRRTRLDRRRVPRRDRPLDRDGSAAVISKKSAGCGLNGVRGDQNFLACVETVFFHNFMFIVLLEVNRYGFCSYCYS